MDSCNARFCVVFSLLFCRYIVLSELVLKPKDTESKLGVLTFLNCSTNNGAEEVFWFHYNIGSKERKLIYGYGQFYPPYQGRFQLEKIEYSGQWTAYNLVIPSTISQDSGTYECQDGAGHGDQSPQIQLILLADDPICQSDIRPEGVVGPNSCGLTPEDLHLTCKAKFHGNQPPVMAWFQEKSNQPMTDCSIDSLVSGDFVICNLTIEADSSIDGSYFECRTTRSPTDQYKCTSDGVTVVGSRTLASVILCLAFAVPLAFIGGCFGGWKVKKSRREKPNAENKESVKLEMESRRQIETKPTFDELLVERERLKNRVNRLEQIIHCKDKVNYYKEPKFVQSIETKERSIINGLTLLRTQLYVVHENSSSIEVYDSMTFNFERSLNIENLINPLDIASSELSEYLYIVDLNFKKPLLKTRNGEELKTVNSSESKETEDFEMLSKVEDDNSYIKAFDISGKKLHEWNVEDAECRLSVYESNVIACLSNRRQIVEYSANGEELQRVKVSPSDGFDKLFHAIKVTESDFVVSHVVPRSPDHRLTMVNADGKVKFTVDKLNFNRILPEIHNTMNAPLCLVEDCFKSILVTDTMKCRILLFTPTLDKCEELILDKGVLNIDKRNLLTGNPVRIVLDETNGRLFIAMNRKENKTWTTNGGISVINIA